MNETRRFTLRIFRFLATQMILGEPRWAVGFAKGKNSTAQPHRGRRFVCSEKPKDPQDEPAGFALRDYGFWWRSSRSALFPPKTRRNFQT